MADSTKIRYEPQNDVKNRSNIWEFMREHDIETFEDLHTRTVESVDGVEDSGLDWFWDEVVDHLDIEFYEPYHTVRDDTNGPQFTDWYVGGELNIAHNVVDRHAKPTAETRNNAACLWEGENGRTRVLTYHDLYRQSNKVANALEERGVGTGDTVCLYMPMVPEIVPILYGCFKVGAIAVPIFSGFGVDATATRIEDAGCSVLFTGDGFYRRGSEVELKPTADEAIAQTAVVDHIIVYERLGIDIPWDESRDEWWDTAVLMQSDEYETKSLDSSEQAMLLYSSGTTGKPKGINQTHAGALVQCAKEIYFSFDHQPSDRFFWLSDIGWMMGPWMLIGNHTLGGTVMIYEGAPDYPNPDRLWQLIDEHGISVFGVSPTAVRALQKHGNEWVEKSNLSTLRLLGSTGGPWDEDSWNWFYDHVGNSKTPIMNISGGTEIFGCFLQPLPVHSLKPCTLGGPALGMDVDIVNGRGQSIVDNNERGYLVARSSAPSMTRSLWSGDERYLEAYWNRFDDMWNHGDWARKDEDGFWFLLGRSDEVLNVAGRKVGPAEIEEALIDHSAVNAAATIGVDDETKGTAIVAFVILESSAEASEEVIDELKIHVGDKLGQPFRPREILVVDEFPKTQSGKIVRRLLHSVYEDEEIGDLSSIENPGALEKISDMK